MHPVAGKTVFDFTADSLAGSDDDRRDIAPYPALTAGHVVHDTKAGSPLLFATGCKKRISNYMLIKINNCLLHKLY